MKIQEIIDKFEPKLNDQAIIWKDGVYNFSDIVLKYHTACSFIDNNNIESGATISLEAGFSPNAFAMLLACFQYNLIVSLIDSKNTEKIEEYLEIGQVEYRCFIDINTDEYFLKTTNYKIKNKLLIDLKIRKSAGLILYSSGTTGAKKAVVHDAEILLDRFYKISKPKRLLTFLNFDHIGGINTLLYTILNLGTAIIPSSNKVSDICNAIETYKVEVLPTTPSFLNLLLSSEIYKKYNLSSLKTITYATEVMSENTLNKLNIAFPNINLFQSYGLSETGILSTKSESSKSTWIKIKSDTYKVRIVDNMMEIKSQFSMLGYLNAPSPFTEDGWFITQDCVEEKDGYIKILGRQFDIINVGGLKVYPQEIENILINLSNVEDVIVYGKKNIFVGQVVCAVFTLKKPEDKIELRKRMRSFCKDKLSKYKIPQEVIIAENKLYSERFKKRRNIDNDKNFVG